MRHTLYRDLLAVFVCLGIFYLVTLSIRPIGVPDEGRYASIAYHMYLSGDYVSPMLNGGLFMDKPALYYWLEAFSMHIFGVSSWAIRIPPALLGIASSLSLYIVGYRFFNRTTAWLAALILGTSPFWYGLSQYANMDLEVAAWITLTLSSIVLGLYTPHGNKRRLLFYLAYIFAAAATLTKGLMGIAFPILILGVFSFITWQWRLIKEIYLPTGIIIYLTLTLPWMLLMQKAHPEFFHYFFITQQFDRYLASSFNNVQPFLFFAEIIIVGLLPWSLIIPISLWRGCKPHPHYKISDSSWGATLFLSLWAILLFIFFSYPQSKPVGYILPVFPPLSLLVAHSLYQWTKKKEAGLWPKYSMIILSLFIGLLFTLAGTLPLEIMAPYASIRGWILAVGLSGLIFPFWAIFCKQPLNTLKCLFALPVVLSASLPAIVGHLDTRSLQPVITKIQPYITPDTLIINYDKYFYDLPLIFHLKKPITVVANWKDKTHILASDSWRRELFLGMQSTPQAKQWLITPHQFDQLLKTTGQPVIVFAREQSKNMLVNHSHLHVIMQYHGTLILSNNTYQHLANKYDD